jgi:glycosyltransferase involved in cell wall biosynthesis
MLRVLAVTNLYPTPANPTLGTFVEQQVKGLREIGVCMDVLFVDRAGGGAAAYRRVGEQIAAQRSRAEPDVVHVMYGGVMAERATRAVRDLPALVSFCGSDLLGENLPGLIRRLMVRFGVWASYRAARRAQGIIVKSRNLEQALPRDVSRSKVRIIPNGVDLDRFQPLDKRECQAGLGWDPGRFHALFPANTGTPRKRLWLAQGAVDAVNTGSVMQAELHALQKVPHDKVPTWLNASDAVLLTSEHEGSPNIVKEALACDVPVVSVDVGDVAERIEGIAGCHLAAAEASALARKLELVYGSQSRIRGRERMHDLSLEAVAKRVAAFYAEVSEGWRRGHGARAGYGSITA